MEVWIGFSTSQHWLSRVIRWATRSPYSHTWLLYRDPVFQVWTVFQAGLTGTHTTAAEPFWRSNLVTHVMRPPWDLSAGLAQAGPYLGSCYDVQGLLGMAWVVAGRWLRRKWRNPHRGPAQMFCCELIARILSWSSVPRSVELPPDDITPRDLAGFLERAGAGIVERPRTPADATGGPAT